VKKQTLRSALIRCWLEDLKARAQLKGNSNPLHQEIPAGSTFAFGPDQRSLAEDDLVPINIFTYTANVLADGVEWMPSPAISFLSKADPSVVIELEDGSTGKLVSAARANS
jgi:hypothetical protein